MVGSGFPERIGGTISESLLAPDREASRAFPKRAEVDASPVPIAATIALEMIGPITGTVITLRQQSSLFANASISSVTVSIRLSSRRQSPASSVTMRTMRGERTSARLARRADAGRAELRGIALLINRVLTIQ